MQQLSIVRRCLGLMLFLAACGESKSTNDAENAGFLRPATSPSAETVPSTSVPPAALATQIEMPAPVADEPVASEQVPAASPLPTRDSNALEHDASSALDAGDSVRAAAIYSDLLLAAVRTPGGEDRGALARWSAALARAQRGYRWSKRGPWPSVEVEVQPGDSLTAIRKRVLSTHPGMQVCTGMIARANELSDERAIHPKDKLRVPTDRASVLVDLSALWVLYMHADQVVAAWEVGIGKDGSATETGTYVIGGKQREPMWFRPGHDPVPFGDPQNPLGTRWLAWYRDGQPTSIGFHGTNDVTGIGKRVSKGCIRMRNEDVEVLFDILPEGASVIVQP